LIDRIRAESIRTLYAQMRATSMAAIVVTLYMIGTGALYTAWPAIVGWTAFQASGQVWREILIRRFRQANPPDEALERWAHHYVLQQVWMGLVWGSTIFLFGHPEHPVTIALVMCCLYSITSGAVPAQAYAPAGAYTVIGLIFACVLVRLLATGNFGYTMLGVASALFGVTMVAYCRTQAKTVREGFRIRFENEALLEALSRQKAEAEEARRKAELANLAKSQFLAAASHDLRQPLYALSLFSASLDALNLDAEARAVVARLHDSVGVMESLFDKLLDISRLEAGVVKPQTAPVDVDALFDRLSQVFLPQAIERGIELRFRSNGEWVASDDALIEQVLSNLVSNALRNTAQGGVLIAARPRRETVQLEVWDTGSGIGAEDRERIFDEFVQLGNPERDRRKGLGLGLSIARRGAALLGSEIRLASRPGWGSRFSVAQPVAAAAEPVRAVRQGIAPMPRARDLPLLVVEDDRDVRAALGDVLARWGLAFDAVGDAESALARIAEGARYGLVLTDYRLGGALDGLALAGEIAARHPAPRPAAVLITGDFDAALVAAAHARGIPLLHKPLRPADLRQLLGLG